jgi:hypothetical protein
MFVHRKVRAHRGWSAVRFYTLDVILFTSLSTMFTYSRHCFKPLRIKDIKSYPNLKMEAEGSSETLIPVTVLHSRRRWWCTQREGKILESQYRQACSLCPLNSGPLSASLGIKHTFVFADTSCSLLSQIFLWVKSLTWSDERLVSAEIQRNSKSITDSINIPVLFCVVRVERRTQAISNASVLHMLMLSLHTSTSCAPRSVLTLSSTPWSPKNLLPFRRCESRTVVFNLFCSPTPRYNISSTLHTQSCWRIIQVIHSL